MNVSKPTLENILRYIAHRSHFEYFCINCYMKTNILLNGPIIMHALLDSESRKPNVPGSAALIILVDF
jgi:hypothetical protein